MTESTRQVLILFHVHDLGDGDEDVKIVGVYSDRVTAEAAIHRLRLVPGFAEHPDRFQMDPYTVDEDNWTEGFLTEWIDRA